MKKADQKAAFVDALAAWYAVHKRTLPWRDLTDRDRNLRAYKVLVSEVMLQQTQVPRVIVTFKKFIQTFPSTKALAEASNAEILIAWRGMGYNSRALRLRDAARTIMDDYHGVFPTELDQLLSIKGIGHYTAAAVRNFAFHLPTPMIDTNVRRVLHRSFFGPENADGTWPVSDKILLPLCEEILDDWMQRGHACFDFFAALMDFGSLVHTKSNPKWEMCPLTARKIMKTTRKMFEAVIKEGKGQSKAKKEPGRIIGGRFTPNRIVRGRIIEVLRDHPNGLSSDVIGSHVAIDWNPEEHREWLQSIMEKLTSEMLLQKGKNKYQLKV